MIEYIKHKVGIYSVLGVCVIVTLNVSFPICYVHSKNACRKKLYLRQMQLVIGLQNQIAMYHP